MYNEKLITVIKVI